MTFIARTARLIKFEIRESRYPIILFWSSFKRTITWGNFNNGCSHVCQDKNISHGFRHVIWSTLLKSETFPSAWPVTMWVWKDEYAKCAQEKACVKVRAQKCVRKNARAQICSQKMGAQKFWTVSDAFQKWMGKTALKMEKSRTGSHLKIMNCTSGMCTHKATQKYRVVSSMKKFRMVSFWVQFASDAFQNGWGKCAQNEKVRWQSWKSFERLQFGAQLMRKHVTRRLKKNPCETIKVTTGMNAMKELKVRF